MVLFKTERKLMDVDEWMKQIEKKDNRLVQWLIQKMAQNPGISLICLLLCTAVILPLIVNYILTTIYVVLKFTGILITTDEISWSTFLSKDNFDNVGFMLTVTTVLIIVWYKGMNNIYSKYFSSNWPSQINPLNLFALGDGEIKSIK